MFRQGKNIKEEAKTFKEKGKNIVVAFALGRLAVRAFLNLLLGGTLFGGNFL